VSGHFRPQAETLAAVLRSAIRRFPAENVLLNRRNLLGEWQDIEVSARMADAGIA
jgi:hypothetical protein